MVLESIFGAGMATFIAGFFLVFFLIFLVIYLYCAIALMAIAKKTRTSNGWFAFIPVLNFYLLTQLAGVSGWWTLAIFASFIPLIGSLALGVITIWFFWRIAEKVGMPGWTSLLMLIPIVNFIVLGIYAWKK